MFCLKSKSIETHLLYHGEQTVGAGGRQVFRKADVINEMEIGIQDVVRSLVVKHLNQKRNYTFDDYRVGISRIVDLPFWCEIGVSHTRL